MFLRLGGLAGGFGRRYLAGQGSLNSIKKVTEKNSFVFPREPHHSPLHTKRVTVFSFPKSEKQLLEERENPNLNIRASGLTKRLLDTKTLTKWNQKLDQSLEPELNQRRYELWNGIWETWDTVSIATRVSFNKSMNRVRSARNQKRIELSYSQIMQLDRSKREAVKLAAAMSPFFFIPGSLLWWFPALCIFAKFYPSYIMPAHYMRGRAARIYYGRIHRRRENAYNEITNSLNYVRNNRYCPYIVSDVLRHVHTGKLPKVDDIQKLHEWIKKEDKMHYSQAPDRVQRAYSKMLLHWTQLFAVAPRVIRARNIDKRLKKIVQMDSMLRENGTLQSLTKGQLSEALFIRGVNGFEAMLSREAKLFWLENWLKLTEDINASDLDGQSYEGCPVDANATYTVLSMFLWAVNFNQDTYLKYKQALSNGEVTIGNGRLQKNNGDYNCPHCGFDCSELMMKKAVEHILLQQSSRSLSDSIVKLDEHNRVSS